MTQPQQIEPQRNPVRDIRAYLETSAVQSQLAKVLPAEMRPERIARVALTAMTKNPKLLDCTRESLLRCLMECSGFGLEPDGRHAHLIPYKAECTLIIDWKGLVALAMRSGKITNYNAVLVKERDPFTWHNNVVNHSIDWKSDRGETVLAYSYVKYLNGAEDWEVMTLPEVEAIRKQSRSGNAGPWVANYEEMVKKGLALDTLIPTPDGWTTMEDLTPGDTVFDMDGKQTCVLAVSEIKNLPCFRINFTNGDSIVCDDEHRWLARFGGGNAWRNQYEVHTINTLLDAYSRGESITVPVAGPLEIDSGELIMDPYLFGLWLGDGNSHGAAITCAKADSDHVQKSAIAAGYSLGTQREDTRTGAVCVRITGGMFRDLNKLGVIQNKHVPLSYLRASESDRLALLQGLIDSDGHIDKARGRAHFCNKNPLLSAAVAELVHSLGDVPQRSTRTMRGFSTECTAYIVLWKPSVLCARLPRKAAHFQGRKITKYRAVESIERVDSVPTKCIAVSSPTATYLCGESMIPTHNTVIRRHSKRLTLSPEFTRAVERDDGEHEMRNVTPSPRAPLPPPHMREALPPPDPEPDQQGDVGNGEEWDGERGDEGGDQ